MSARMQLAILPVLLLAGFALRYPWRTDPPMQPSASSPIAVAATPERVPASIATSSIDTAEDGYSGFTPRQFAAEPALIDLIEDQASDPDPEVREEASAALDLGFEGNLDVPADGDPPHP
jgi:hypothetical protein